MTPKSTPVANAPQADREERFFGHLKVWNSNLPHPHTQDFAFFRNVGIQRNGTVWTIAGDALESRDAPTSAWKPFSIKLDTKGTIGRTARLTFDENVWTLSEGTEIEIETQGTTEVRVNYKYPHPGQGPDGNGAWILQPGTIFTAVDRQ